MYIKNLPTIISIILWIIFIHIYDSYNDSKKYIELKNEQVTCLEDSIKKYMNYYDDCVNNNWIKNEIHFSYCIYEHLNSNQQSIKYCQDNFYENYRLYVY